MKTPEAPRGQGRTRRRLIKGGVALASGLAAAGAYVRPALRTVSMVEVAYASGAPYETDKDKDKDKPDKPKKDK